MFSHIMLGSNDLERSKRFYDALFAATGGPSGQMDPKGRLTYAGKDGRLMISRPIDGQPATAANGGTVGFSMASPEEGDAWHAAGVANGGQSVEDPPGLRDTPFGSIYLAYLRDPDGNKLCGLHRAG